MTRLSKDEIEAFKQEYLRTLELEEARRAEERRKVEAEPAQEILHDETSARERERALNQLKEELEEKFYKQRGYKRYINHRGKVLWLTPEEYRFRKERKKRHKGGSGGAKKQRVVESVLIFAATIVIAVLAGYFLAGR